MAVLELVTEKICSRCKESKPASDFGKNRRCKDGLTSWCLPCKRNIEREWKAAHKELVSERSAIDYERHKPERQERHREYSALPSTKMAVNTRLRARRVADPEGTRQRDRQRYAKHHDMFLECSRKWRMAHPEFVRIAAARRRARMSNGSGITASEWSAKKDYYNNCCAYCLQSNDALEMDHMIPLSRGGEHSANNIVPACRRCNSSKNAKTPLEFLQMQVRLGVA